MFIFWNCSYQIKSVCQGVSGICSIGSAHTCLKSITTEHSSSFPDPEFVEPNDRGFILTGDGGNGDSTDPDQMLHKSLHQRMEPGYDQWNCSINFSGFYLLPDLTNNTFHNTSFNNFERSSQKSKLFSTVHDRWYSIALKIELYSIFKSIRLYWNG